MNIDKITDEKHDGDVMCLALYEQFVFSGGWDGKIKVWDEHLNLIKTIDAHDGCIYCIAVSKHGKLYSSGSDGCVKFLEPPYDSIETLFQSDNVVQAIYFDGDIFLTGDEKGVVTTWENDKMIFKYNLVEEIKSIACEATSIYTVRDLDVVISEIIPGKAGKYCTKGVIEGRYPLALLGPVVEGKHSFLASADRTGRGVYLANNLPGKNFLRLWHFPDLHSMILNALCGNDSFLFSGGYDGTVKALTDLKDSRPTVYGEMNIGCCINALVCGSTSKVFVGGSDGMIRLLHLNK